MKKEKIGDIFRYVVIILGLLLIVWAYLVFLSLGSIGGAI